MPGEWWDKSWGIVEGCTPVSRGCDKCWAAAMLKRFGQNPHEVRTFPERLDQPLHWRKPQRVFVAPRSDLFHEDVPEDYLDKVFAGMALASQHTFLVLTKRPERMMEYLNDENVSFRVGRAVAGMRCADDAEEIKPIPGYAGYFASSQGYIYSDKRGTRRRMRPDVGKDGHERVQLHREGNGARGDRLLVHRLILETFVGRAPTPDAQTRHLDGKPRNNLLSNLAWGTPAENREDSRRHGTSRRYWKLEPEEAAAIRRRWTADESAVSIARDYGISDTQVRNIGRGLQWNTKTPMTWPLTNLWCGVSVEDQETADERIPILLDTPAAKRFVSAEPLLAPIQLGSWQHEGVYINWLTGFDGGEPPIPGLDWLVTAPESGPRRRYCDLDWVRSLRDQCEAAGVPFMLKHLYLGRGRGTKVSLPLLDGRRHEAEL